MRFQIEVPNERERLGELLSAIDGALADNAIAREVRDDLLLIAEEVACNAMEHGPGDDARSPHHRISVDIARHGDRLHVEFRDTGQPFDPLSEPSPDLHADILDRPIGGLGVHLVREIAETVSYARVDPHNILRVVLRTP